MLGQQENGIKLNCTEQSIPEFPNLLFGTEAESGRPFFDATLYIHKQGLSINVRDFFVQYRKPIESLCEAYDISYKNVCKVNQSGHCLIDGNFVYLFIAFVEPNFLGYMCDRIQELFAYGVAVSDTYLLQAAKERLSNEVLEAINNGRKSDQREP